MKRIIPLMFLSVALVLLLVGCGSSNRVTTTGTPNMMIQTGDATNDQIVKFELTITSIVLNGTGGTSNTGNLLSSPTDVEFVHEAGRFEPLALANVPQGTYSGATIMASNPEVVAVVNGAPTKLTATLSSSTITVTFTSNITVGSSPMTFVNFDLSLANSITINGTSATIAPTFTVTTKTVASDDNNEGDDNGEIEDVHGTVTNVTAPNFTIQTSQSMMTFATDTNTRFSGGLTSLSDIKMGDMLEVDGVTKSDGTKLATKVEREESQNGQEVEGIMSAVTGSPATQITVAEQVDSAATVGSTKPVTVNVQITPNTQFFIRPDRLNVSVSIPVVFDASHLGPGQRVEVDSSSTSSPMVADKIKLREQALMGTVSNANGNTFTLTVSPTSAFASLSGVSTVNVIMLGGFDEQATPMNGATIRVRGLVLVNGSAVTMLAVRSDDNM